VPFRSETEQIREQLRRIEETTRGVLEEKSDLERQLGGRNAQRRWGIILGATILVAVSLGYGTGTLEASTRATKFLALRAHENANELEQEQARRYQCRGSEQHALSRIAECENEKANARRREATRATPCRCPPHDPDCMCLDQLLAPPPNPPGSEPFDRHATVTVLAGLQRNVESCFKPKRPTTLHAAFNFLPKGNVESVVIDSSSGDVTPAEKACLVAALRTAKVPAFGGGPVRVGKTYKVGETPSGGHE
jgi:hypothetical protein